MKTFKNILFWIIVLIIISLIGLFSYKTYSEIKDNKNNTEIQNEISDTVTIITDTNYHIGAYDESKFPTEKIEEINKIRQKHHAEMEM